MKFKHYYDLGFKRLYWSSDKEQIKTIIQRIPDKYLKGLQLSTRGFSHKSVYINYDGYRFQVSPKTLKSECVRRGLAEWGSVDACDWKVENGVGSLKPNGKKDYYYIRKY